MLPTSTKNILKKNLNRCFSDYYDDAIEEFVLRDSDRESLANELGIANTGSAFIDYYTVVGFPPLGRGDELLTLENIVALSTDDYPDLLDQPDAKGLEDYLRISSIEGEGSYFYNRKSDAVYDVNWGQEPDMVSGKLEPIFSSFAEFLDWYYGS